MSAIAAFFRIGYNMYNNKLGTIQVLHQQVFFNSGPINHLFEECLWIRSGTYRCNQSTSNFKRTLQILALWDRLSTNQSVILIEHSKN